LLLTTIDSQRLLVGASNQGPLFLAPAEDGNYLARSAVPSQCRVSRETFFLSSKTAEAHWPWQLFSFLPYKTTFFLSTT